MTICRLPDMNWGVTQVVDDATRFEGLFSGYYWLVLSYARRRACDDTAQDVVNEVFAIAWRCLDDVPSDAAGWLIATARKVLANERRSGERRSALYQRLGQERTPSPSPSDERIEAAQRWSTALARLSPRDREVLTLVAWDGLTNRQAATALGCSQSAFGMRLNRARRRLLDALAATDETGRDIAETIRRDRSST